MKARVSLQRFSSPSLWPLSRIYSFALPTVYDGFTPEPFGYVCSFIEVPFQFCPILLPITSLTRHHFAECRFQLPGHLPLR
jgi:hypothetical protein